MKRWRPSRRMRGKIRQNRHAGQRQGPAPDPRWERQQLQAHLRRMARAQIVSRELRAALEGPLGFAYGPYDNTPTTPNPAMVILNVFDGERYTSRVYPANFTTTYVTGER